MFKDLKRIADYMQESIEISRKTLVSNDKLREATIRTQNIVEDGWKHTMYINNRMYAIELKTNKAILTDILNKIQKMEYQEAEDSLKSLLDKMI